MIPIRLKFRRALQRTVNALQRWLTPSPDLSAQNRYLEARLNEEVLTRQALERVSMGDAQERIGELIEARQMAGSGPWNVSAAVIKQTDAVLNLALESLRQPQTAADYFHDQAAVALRETTPLLAQGAYGDIELALQNVEWRREINLSWLEFSRWGIQQIILICRLHYIKNPIIQRGINVSAQYVFGRGVEVSSPDPDANDVLKEFFERNQTVLGQVALTDLERRKFYDGNLFFAFFSDTIDTGQTTVRTIDATEIMDVVCDPDDTDKPQYYHRQWTPRNFNIMNGQTSTEQRSEWYPALGYDPDIKPKFIGDRPVNWDTPVYHRKCGQIAKWHFGCPLAYAALDWARAARRFLEACATQKQSLAQISMLLTTKGGQAALEGQKQGLSTTVGPQTNLWDINPTAVNASIFGAGPGTQLKPFPITGAGGDPEEVRRFEIMVFRVFGCPETFWADVKTGNLATATSLDRPTELNFLEKQEAWREDLTIIGKVALQNSLGAANGKLQEAWRKRDARPENVVVMEATRISKKGQTVRYEAAKPSDDKIEVMVTFPSIREADNPALVTALVQSATLGNKGGQIVGIDEKEMVKKLYELNGIEDGEEIAEEQYPSTGPDKYDPNRTKEDAAAIKAAIPTAPVPVQPGPEAPGGHPQQQAVAAPQKAAEALVRRLLEAARRLKDRAA